jgi:UDP-3-O-[3-hydroxymyristoyl] N-acetylglucosamine deacetylase
MAVTVDRVKYSGRGITSGSAINMLVEKRPAGHGIVFELFNEGELNQGVKPEAPGVRVNAQASYVVNTMRNVVLGAQGKRLCIVEHFLAACTLWGLDDLWVGIDGPELPLGDGSAKFFIDLFEQAGWDCKRVEPTISITEPIVVSKGDRQLLALPSDGFSASYMMDWNHPLIGKRWRTWAPSEDIRQIADARTFGPLKEHQLLGIADQVVSLTESGFSHELRFEDEPVRHKILDLIGDLRLCGINPLALKARFISIKAGHEMDVEMAKRLIDLLAKS